MIARWNKYRASEEGRAAFRAIVTRQTIHQGTITAIDQAIELAFLAGGVAAVEELGDNPIMSQGGVTDES